jgi:hypothetical protein
MWIRAFSGVGLASFLLTACGAGGTLEIDLTDASSELTALDRVYITLSAVEVHVVDKEDKNDGDPKDVSIDNDDNWRVVVDRAGTFDLLALQNNVTSPLGEIEVPIGKITQIRLHIDADGENKVVLKTGEICALERGNVNTTGIKINHPFKAIEVPEGERLGVVIDFDLKNSIEQTGACRFKLEPVLKIKTIERR